MQEGLDDILKGRSSLLFFHKIKKNESRFTLTHYYEMIMLVSIDQKRKPRMTSLKVEMQFFRCMLPEKISNNSLEGVT